MGRLGRYCVPKKPCVWATFWPGLGPGGRPKRPETAPKLFQKSWKTPSVLVWFFCSLIFGHFWVVWGCTLRLLLECSRGRFGVASEVHFGLLVGRLAVIAERQATLTYPYIDGPPSTVAAGYCRRRSCPNPCKFIGFWHGRSEIPMNS